MRSIAVCRVLILCSGWLDAQVVVSRRNYAQHGRTFRQIWLANVGGLDFRQLTHSARDHAQPLCSRDGKLIYFVSDPDPERSRNGYGDGGNREVWAYDRRTGQERFVWRTSREDGLYLHGVAAKGGLLVQAGTELHTLLRNARVIDKVAEVKADESALSPDGRRLALVIAES